MNRSLVETYASGMYAAGNITSEQRNAVHMVQGHTSEIAHQHYVMHDASMEMHASLANQIVNGSPEANPAPSNLGASTASNVYSTPTKRCVGSMGTAATLTSLATPGPIRLNIQELLIKTQEPDVNVDVAVMPWGTQHPHFLKGHGPTVHVPWTTTEIAFIGGKFINTFRSLRLAKMIRNFRRVLHGCLSSKSKHEDHFVTMPPRTIPGFLLW